MSIPPLWCHAPSILQSHILPCFPHFNSNQSQSQRSCSLQIEVVRALDYHSKFEEAALTCGRLSSNEKTFYSQMSQTFRLADVPFPPISLKLASGFLSFSAELQFQPMMLLLLKVPLFTLILARRQATKEKRKGGNDDTGEMGLSKQQFHEARVYLQKAILNLCKFLSRASQYTT